MRISPEPLHPLRKWRELWQPERSRGDDGYPEHHAKKGADWKPAKKGGFHWLSHLFNREIRR